MVRTGTGYRHGRQRGPPAPGLISSPSRIRFRVHAIDRAPTVKHGSLLVRSCNHAHARVHDAHHARLAKGGARGYTHPHYRRDVSSVHTGVAGYARAANVGKSRGRCTDRSERWLPWRWLGLLLLMGARSCTRQDHHRRTGGQRGCCSATGSLGRNRTAGVDGSPHMHMHAYVVASHMRPTVSRMAARMLRLRQFSEPEGMPCLGS